MTWNLSDKMFWSEKRCAFNPQSQPRYLQKDVKEFIKRLKEGLCWCHEDKQPCNNCNFINELAGDEIKMKTKDNDLKQEAIKWVKKLDDGIYLFQGVNTDGLNESNRGIIAWIRNFFNITEEDLKLK